MKMINLFDDQDLYGTNEDPLVDFHSQQIALYLERGDADLFKKLCKKGMKTMYGDAANDSNMSQYLLALLKEQNGE